MRFQYRSEPYHTAQSGFFLLFCLLVVYVVVSGLCDWQDEVLIAGFGRRGHAVGDIPGVRFKVS